MRKYIKPYLIITLFNLFCLFLGSLFTNPGVTSDWYLNLIKAPWTPPGWVFAASWTIIALTYSILGSHLYRNDKFLFTFYLFSWFLNIIWNPIFFYFNWTVVSAIDITLLLFTILLINRYFRKFYKKIWYVSIPYIIWLIVASSLNWYIVFNN